MSYKKSPIVFVLMLILTLIGLSVLYIAFFKPFPSQQAKEVVEAFYNYEQNGNFAASWALFHSKMKERLPDATYVEERSNILRNDYGVVTFRYSIGFPNKEKNWSMTEDSPPFDVVYEIPVTQMYNGKYGNFEIHQDVFAVQEGDEWKLLWDYKTN
ncbi:hypothetical protein [Bacillus sp. Marseille-P3661]|uniref:hypothetical protein n=1 Tax=Bacillus sp. Marseille-P3661 TaxID=1936234 RepID=UPI0021554257|nr:hypothetical protein [Bacillus sp. Marseille-P3661]